MALHLFAEQRLAGEIELQADPGGRYVADVVVGADVGQVDGEAGVAPGGTEADFLGLDQDDLVGKMQRQLARGEAGEAGADHHPAGGAPAVVAGFGRGGLRWYQPQERSSAGRWVTFVIAGT